MDNNMDEKWIHLTKVKVCKHAVVAISNTGKFRRADGTVGVLKLRHQLKYDGEIKECYRIIAEHFLITVKRTDQTCIDHVTHCPTEYNVNDVRNLRWCTKSENSNFEEARRNISISKSGEKHPRWRGENVGPMGAYKRALQLYKYGSITEDEMQTYRDALKEFRRDKSH